jgi:hypothetical protein
MIMEGKNFCEVFGTLEKLEELSSITTHIIPGSVVFESLAPFWGYYYDNPGEYSPLYVYLALDKEYSVFDIARATMVVQDEIGVDFDVAKAFVSFNDRTFHVIRLRHIAGYEMIQKIQEAFLKNGIKPAMSHSHWNKVTADIIFRKIFCLSKLSGGIYMDTCEKFHFYLQIPKRLTFQEFVEVTQKVRNNWLGIKFDAALGAYLLNCKVIENVRIYSEKVTEEELREIQKLYLQKIK